MSQVLDTPEIIQERPIASVTETLDAPMYSAAALREKPTPSRPLYRIVAAVWRAILPQHSTSREGDGLKAEMAVDRLIRTDPYLYIMTMSG